MHPSALVQGLWAAAGVLSGGYVVLFLNAFGSLSDAASGMSDALLVTQAQAIAQTGLTTITVMCGLLLLAFVQPPLKSGKTAATTDVLVARSLIPRGSAGNLVATEQLVQRSGLPSAQVKVGAITDPRRERSPMSDLQSYIEQRQLTT